MFKVNYKDTRTISITLTLNIVHTFFDVSIVEFEQVDLLGSDIGPMFQREEKGKTDLK